MCCAFVQLALHFHVLEALILALFEVANFVFDPVIEYFLLVDIYEPRPELLGDEISILVEEQANWVAAASLDDVHVGEDVFKQAVLLDRALDVLVTDDGLDIPGWSSDASVGRMRPVSTHLTIIWLHL